MITIYSGSVFEKPLGPKLLTIGVCTFAYFTHKHTEVYNVYTRELSTSYTKLYLLTMLHSKAAPGLCENVCNNLAGSRLTMIQIDNGPNRGTAGQNR